MDLTILQDQINVLNAKIRELEKKVTDRQGNNNSLLNAAKSDEVIVPIVSDDKKHSLKIRELFAAKVNSTSAVKVKSDNENKEEQPSKPFGSRIRFKDLAKAQIRIDREEKIKRERIAYVQGLSIHGLNRIIEGPIIGRVFWTILVFGSLIASIYMTQTHWVDYLQKNSRTDTRLQMKDSILFPMLSICNYVELNRARRSFAGTAPLHTRPGLTTYGNMKQCGANFTGCLQDKTVKIKVADVSPDYVHHNIQNELVTFDNSTNCFNVQGYSQTVPSYFLDVQIVQDRRSDVWTELYINPSTETYLEANPTVYWASEGFYHINIHKKIITRLGLPYTDCIEWKGTYEQNKFVGNYTVTKCKKGCFLEQVYKQCKAIPDMYHRHLREPNRMKNERALSNEEGEACLRAVETNSSATESCAKVCAIQPCYEEDIKMGLDYHWSPDRQNLLEMAFTFPSLSEETVREVAAYTWEDLFANFGGCVGLMTGASILSVAEIFVLIGLVVIEADAKRKKAKVASRLGK